MDTWTTDWDDFCQLLHAPDREKKRWITTPWIDAKAIVLDAAWCEDMDAILKAVRATLAAGVPVWASFCVDLSFDRERQTAGGTPTAVLPALSARSKRDRMKRRDLTPNHAMLITHTFAGSKHAEDPFAETPTHWRILNSWGKRDPKMTSDADHSHKHHDIVATDEWLREHMFHAVVSRAACAARGISLPPIPKKDEVHVLEWNDVLTTVAR